MAGIGDLYKPVFDHSPIAMALIQTDGRFVLTNQAFRELALRDGADPLPSSLWDLLEMKDRRSSLDRTAMLHRRGERHSWLVRLSRTGRPVLWQLDVSMIGGAGGSPLLLANARDVTLQLHTEGRLMRAKDAAERSTRTKSAFLANMSHEIRTPIHTITGMTDLLLDTELDEEQREYGNQVRFAAEALLSLVDDVLDFSKIEAGRLSLETIDFDLERVVEEAVAMVSLQAHRKGLETIVWVGPSIPRTVRGDPGRLRQIIVNLFNNAVKFTSEGGEVKLAVEAAGDSCGRTRVRFEVTDTGIGIPKEKVGTLFNAFSQVDSSTTRKFGGTGLGLSISQSLVHLMEGEIGADSIHGVGSTFWFEIPFHVVESAAPDNPVCERRRVLLIDDNESSRGAIRDYLERWGARSTVVSTGVDGLRELRKAAGAGHPVDLAIVDLELPGMDGWQFASEVNADHDINATALILMIPTGLMAAEAKMKRLMWFNGYASKPVNRCALKSEIMNALAGELELRVVDDAIEDAGEGMHVRAAGARLVVAEDHLVNQTLFRTILEKLGHRVIPASNGQDAIDAVERERPDLVFMDIQMPEMNGYEATDRIRRSGYTGPIIAVSANAVKGERENCLAAGMDDFLAKPFRREDLVPIIARWTAGSSSSAEACVSSDSSECSEPENREVPVFDFAAAVDRFAGNEGIVRTVIDRFIRKCDAIVPELRTDLESADFVAVRREAHGLKGAARSLEARPLGDAAALLEAAAAAEDEPRCREYLDALTDPISEFRAAALPYCKASRTLSIASSTRSR